VEQLNRALPSPGEASEGLPTQDISVKVDWVQGTMPVTSEKRFREAVDFVVSNFEDTAVWMPDQSRFMGINWQCSGKSVNGIVWMWNPPEPGSSKPGLGFISIPGSVLGSVPARDVWRTVRGLDHEWGFKATRFDVALDDFKKSVSYEQVVDAIKVRNYSRFRNASWQENNDKKFPGWTVYMGSKDSDRRVRYYNKFSESKGRVNAYRWEVQLRNSLAYAAFKDYAAIPPELFEEFAPTYLGAVVAGSVEFVDRRPEVRTSRLERLPWWNELVERFGRVRHKRPQVVKTLQRSIKWIERQVAPTLVVLEQALGLRESIRLIRAMKDEVKERLSRYQEALIIQSKFEYGTKDWLAS
jgi:hypothetical protein